MGDAPATGAGESPSPMNEPIKHYKFTVDFSVLPPLPEDPRTRLPYFSAFKTLLAGERKKIRAWHLAGAGGFEIIQAHTSLVDKSIRHIMQTLSAQATYAPGRVLEGFALIAVGGYGRGELNPYSDIDLLFLHPPKIRKSTDEFIQDVISILWGIGMEIGHSCRTLKDCLKLAGEDLTVKTSMIETRFLIGDQAKYDKFSASITKHLLKKNIRGFLNSKLEEKNSRYGGHQGVVFDPEPNIKDGPGGLRDYHTALWAAAVRFGRPSLREIGFNDAISPQEIDTLYESVNFSLRVRNEIHYLCDKKADVLNLDRQAELARNLGYDAENDTLRVERFMRDYFLHATNIFNLSETIFQLCLHTRRSIGKVLSGLTKTSLGDGFHAEGATLTLAGDAEKIFEQYPGRLLTAFTLCQQHGLEPGIQLKRQIRQGRHRLEGPAISGSTLKEFLFHLLESPGSGAILRMMHRLGVLGQILPEFGQAHCRISYDFYHRFTADEHSLRMIDFLEGLGTGESEMRAGELGSIYRDLPEKALIKFSALLQSMGRATGGEDGPGLKTCMVELSGRLNLSEPEKALAEFLISHLNEMIETALHQDIHEPSVIEAFAGKVRTRQRLAMLYLFSYSELRAVAPGTWTAWKKFLLSELYHRTLQYFDKPESLAGKPQATRDEVYQALHWECPAGQIERHLNLMPEDYLHATHAEEVALHIRLIRSLKDREFILHHHHNPAGKFHHVTLCGPAKRNLFNILIGVLTAKNANILGAQIYLRADDITILTMQVEETERLPGDNLALWKEVKQTLAQVLNKETDIKTLLASRARFMEGRAKAALVPKIYFDNAANNLFTQIRIEARDHQGMLYKISKVLSDYNIQVHRAKISTQGNRGIDMFLVSLRNGKVAQPRLIQRVKEDMVRVLLIEKLEDIP
jgi:[protein-PII] uridylyltransferase